MTTHGSIARYKVEAGGGGGGGGGGGASSSSSSGSQKKAVDSKWRGYQPTCPDYWVIHGEYYDLTSFLSRHPGGQEMLLLGKGRDCTELFESVHVLSQVGVKGMLTKFKVDPSTWSKRTDCPPPPADQFSWAPDGFYSVLKEKVRRHFAEKAKLSTTTTKTEQGRTPTSKIEYVDGYKATWACWLKVTCMLLLWVVLASTALTSGSTWAAVAAACFMNMIGFCVMHDASHFAVSRKVWVNRVCHILWNNWNLWSHFMWLRHHVYGHHSYTGVFSQDPDLVNASRYVRKHHDSRFNKLHEYQHLHGWFIYTIFPNQHVGQAVLYLRAWFRRHIFGVPLDKLPLADLLMSIAIYIPSIYCHFVLPFQMLPSGQALSIILCYWMTQGVAYFVNICPNHDTFDTHEHISLSDAVLEGKRDWGEQQVLGTGDHSTGPGVWNFLVSKLWGGMNYQIEHHLFPSVSHVHYPEVSKYVQETCKEFNIPFVTSSWSYALWRFFVLVKDLSVNDKLKYTRPKTSPAQQQKATKAD